MDNKLKEGVKYDDGKLRWSLVPGGPMREVVKVLMHGAAKYDDHNWAKVDNWRERYYNAARRHLDEWWEGESLDKESNLHHLAHAMCCLLFLMGKEEKDEEEFEHLTKFFPSVAMLEGIQPRTYFSTLGGKQCK